jgi:hypothetical protein
MAITEKQYETILVALADKIKEQETTIFVQKCKIESLEKRVTEAENEGKATPTKLEII